METKIEITRKQIIVVGEVKGITSGQYPKFVWTDKEGKEYKVSPNRTQYFEAIVAGQAVEISFSTYKGVEYPYSASAVKDKLPVQTEVSPSVKELNAEQKAKGDPPKQTMTPDGWAEKDRITRKSIERQTALKEATNIAIAVVGQGKEISPAKVIEIARLFESYLGGSAPAKVKNQLVEEAIKLGAEE